MLWTLAAGAWLLAATPDTSWQVAQTTYELDQQAGKAFTVADRDLNQQYQRLVKSLPAASRARLQAAQLAWIPYRDTWADYRSDTYRGGTIRSMAYTNTRAELTEKRRADFESVLAGLASGAGHTIPSDVEARAKDADARLNDVYASQMKELDPTARQLLVKTELAWLKFRDADLAFWASWRHDAPAARVKAQRLYELTRAQAEALRTSREP